MGDPVVERVQVRYREFGSWTLLGSFRNSASAARGAADLPPKTASANCGGAQGAVGAGGFGAEFRDPPRIGSTGNPLSLGRGEGQVLGQRKNLFKFDGDPVWRFRGGDGGITNLRPR